MAHYATVGFQNRNFGSPSVDDGKNFGMQTFAESYANANNTPSTEGIFQTIDGLTVGHQYTQHFYTTASDFRWVGENEFWQVTFCGQTQNGNNYQVPGDSMNYFYDRNFNRTNATGDSVNANFRWVATNLTFTATAETEKLSFKQVQTLDSRSACSPGSRLQVPAHLVDRDGRSLPVVRWRHRAPGDRRRDHLALYLDAHPGAAEGVLQLAGRWASGNSRRSGGLARMPPITGHTASVTRLPGYGDSTACTTVRRRRTGWSIRAPIRWT